MLSEDKLREVEEQIEQQWQEYIAHGVSLESCQGS